MPSLSSFAARRTMRSRRSFAEPFPSEEVSFSCVDNVSNSMRLGSVDLTMRLTLKEN